MEKINKFFEWIDRFNVPISFRYKKDDNYSTFLGGLISTIIILLTVGFGIYYFIPFVNRKNYSLYYYTINLNQTEEINLYRSKAAIAFGLECSNNTNKTIYDDIKAEDIFEYRMRYIFYEKNGNNTSKKNDTYDISFRTCDDIHFYNNKEIIKSFNEQKTGDVKCIDNLDLVIKNRHQDKHNNFTYFRIDLNAKIDNISFIKEYLLDFDCKIQLYYTDVKIEVNDYNDPVKPFLNEVFLQLNPNMLSKMNAFFMNEYFESVNDLFFPTEGIDKINNLFSRTEQYFLYKDPKDNKKSVANIYIRADTRKMEIKRKYQTVLEFFADTFSFWEDIFLLCKIILTAYNSASLNYYIHKEIFYFKGMQNKYLNINKNSYKYKKLKNILTNNGIIEKEQIQDEPHNIDINLGTNDNDKDTSKTNVNNNIHSMPPISINQNANNEVKNKFQCKYIWKTIKYALIKLFDFVTCKKCKHKFGYEYKLLSNADKIIDDKLDIITYIKNMIIFDIYNFGTNKEMKKIFNLLSMPIIPSDNDDDKNFCRYFSNEDIDNFPFTYTEMKKYGKPKIKEYVDNLLKEIFENI